MACNRRRGSFSKQRRSRRRMGGGVLAGSSRHSGSDFRTAARVSDTVSPAKSCLPVSNSNRTTPKAQMSARRSTGRPLACSGLM